MPSTSVAEALARHAVPDRLRIGRSDDLRASGAGVRSHLADDRGVAWLVPEALREHAAIDAEIATQPVRSAIARRAGSADPVVVWPRWTRCETTAKLLGLPVLSWLDWPGLIVPGDLTRQVAVAHVRLDDVLICCGLRRINGEGVL